MNEIWTTHGFLEHFAEIHESMPDRSFCFILGAGASASSGIPTGLGIVDGWLEQLRARTAESSERAADISEWATAENLQIPGFEYDRRAEFYPDIFDRVFEKDPEQGYASLEGHIEGKSPSVGYAALARILTKTRHRVVVTTNFDDLVTDAISIFRDYRQRKTTPHVCGHEALAAYVRARMRRPLVAKIHRDLVLEPRNGRLEVGELAPQWKTTLAELFRYYTPIVIGYGGNDGSLMGFLEDLAPGESIGRMIWCIRESDPLPRRRIYDVVQRHSGVFVRIKSFDKLMIELAQKLNGTKPKTESPDFAIDRLTESVEKWHTELVRRYRQQYADEDLRTDGIDWPPELDEEKPEWDWWKWVYRAEREAELESESVAIRTLETGIDRFMAMDTQAALWLKGNLAMYLHRQYSHGKKKHREIIDKAGRLRDEVCQAIPELSKCRKGDFEKKFNPAIIQQNTLAEERFFGPTRNRMQARRAVDYVRDALTEGSEPDAFAVARRAWPLATACRVDDSDLGAMLIAEMLLIGSVLTRNSPSALGRAKWCLANGVFGRGVSPGFHVDDLLSPMDLKIDPGHRDLLHQLFIVLQDTSQVNELDRFPAWETCAEVRLDEPWEELSDFGPDGAPESPAVDSDATKDTT